MKKTFLSVNYFFLFIFCSLLLLASCSDDPDNKADLHDIRQKEGHLNGIDVSMYQGDVTWDSVLNDSVHYVIIRASYVSSQHNNTFQVDDKFTAHWDELDKKKIIKGAYHFYRSAEDPVKQAEEFVKLIHQRLEDDDLPPILDFEELQEHAADTSIDKVTNDLKTFLKVVEEKTGRKPIMYTFTNHWYWKGLQAKNAENPFKDYPLWVANYSHTWDNPDGILPYGFTGWNIWQYSDKGQIDGIEKATDLSWFKGSEEDLKQFILSTKVYEKE